jgi:hypothetical protein
MNSPKKENQENSTNENSVQSDTRKKNPNGSEVCNDAKIVAIPLEKKNILKNSNTTQKNVFQAKPVISKKKEELVHVPPPVIVVAKTPIRNIEIPVLKIEVGEIEMLDKPKSVPKVTPRQKKTEKKKIVLETKKEANSKKVDTTTIKIFEQKLKKLEKELNLERKTHKSLQNSSKTIIGKLKSQSHRLEQEKKRLETKLKEEQRKHIKSCEIIENLKSQMTNDQDIYRTEKYQLTKEIERLSSTSKCETIEIQHTVSQNDRLIFTNVFKNVFSNILRFKKNLTTPTGYTFLLLNKK